MRRLSPRPSSSRSTPRKPASRSKTTPFKELQGVPSRCSRRPCREHLRHARGDSTAVSRQGVFPNPEHLPTGSCERARHQPIPRPVRDELPSPEGRMSDGSGVVSGTPMPEAAIDKHRDPPGRKHKIGSPQHRPIPPPPADPVRAKDRDHPQLGRAIPPRTNPRHDLGTFGLGEDVSHGSLSPSRRRNHFHQSPNSLRAESRHRL